MDKRSVKQVMFDPASWVHPGYLPLAAVPASGELRSVVNQLLLRQLALPAAADYRPSNGLNRFLVEHWSLLPEAALLLSAQRHRATLSQQGALYRLPASLQQFARLAIVPAAAAEPLNAPPLAWLQSRKADELLRLRPLADAPLAARLPLFFPPQAVERQQDKPGAFSSLYPLLLAVQYAERYAVSNG